MPSCSSARHEIRSAAVAISLFGLLIGQLVITVLGALAITSEYSTGMIRTSLTTMPRRGTWFAAKGVVFGLVALVAGLVTSFTAFFVGQAILSSWHANVTLGDHNVLRSVIGGGLFLAACGLLSFGIGAILRHSAGAISSAIGLLFVTLILSNFLPGPPSGWFGQIDIDKWIPFYAGAHLWQNQMVGLQPVLTLDRIRGVLRLRGGGDHRRNRPVPAPRRLEQQRELLVPGTSPGTGSSALPDVITGSRIVERRQQRGELPASEVDHCRVRLGEVGLEAEDRAALPMGPRRG